MSSNVFRTVLNVFRRQFNTFEQMHELFSDMFHDLQNRPINSFKQVYDASNQVSTKVSSDLNSDHIFSSI